MDFNGAWRTLTCVGAMLVLGGSALAQQDRSTLKVLNGLALSVFKGYENWQAVGVSETDDAVKLIAANPKMIDAYRAGVPGNGQLFPEGSMVVKIEWAKKTNAQSPYPVRVPDTLKSLAFIERDSKRFPDTHGWAYAKFTYDAKTDTLSAQGSDAKCGYACHTKVAAQDYIFTAYPKR